MQEDDIRAVLRSQGGLEPAEVLIEGGWAGIVVDQDAPRELLVTVYRALVDAFPQVAFELRAGSQIYKGGAGLGAGRHLIAIVGGKGGVGKSTLTVNLALTFAAMGWPAGIVDADLNAPDVPHLLGIHPTQAPGGFGWRLASRKLQPPSKRGHPEERFGVEIMSVGFIVPERMPPMVTSRMLVSTLLRYLVFEIAWSAQILLIDAPPGTGEELQVIARELPLAGAIFVTTPQDLAQMDAERTLTVFSDNGVPVIGVVYNMSSMTCPHCKQEIDLFARSGRLARELPLLAHIPFDVQLSKAADSGRPLVLGDPKGPIAFEFAKLGALVQRWLVEVSESDRQVTTP